MAEQNGSGVIRRRLAAARGGGAEGGADGGVERGWPLALARALQDKLRLGAQITGTVQHRRSLAELLEMPQDHALNLLLEGPGDGIGLLSLPPPVLAGLVEGQVLGRIGTAPLSPRKPSRTDAAIVAPLAEAALLGLEQALATQPDLIWAGGFRYAAFVEDARPLALLLEDMPYRVLLADLALAGSRRGPVLLALPAQGRGQPPQALQPSRDAPDFTPALAARVEGAEAVMTAVLARLTLPMGQLLSLRPGDLLDMPQAALDRISLEGPDGQQLAPGRLGQNRGLRAVRLTDPQAAADAAPAQPVSPAAPAVQALRQSA